MYWQKNSLNKSSGNIIVYKKAKLKLKNDSIQLKSNF